MKFKRKVTQVDAVFWSGDNTQEVVDFFAEILSPEYGPYFNPPDEYNTVQWYDGDDMECDPGKWIVLDDEEWKIMEDQWFRRDYEADHE